jgi:hypothetical protein
MWEPQIFRILCSLVACMDMGESIDQWWVKDNFSLNHFKKNSSDNLLVRDGLWGLMYIGSTSN